MLDGWRQHCLQFEKGLYRVAYNVLKVLLEIIWLGGVSDVDVCKVGGANIWLMKSVGGVCIVSLQSLSPLLFFLMYKTN